MTRPPVKRLLPHEGEAVLLDEIAELRNDGLSAWFTVRAGTAFSNPDGSLAEWAVPEVMAQAASAFGSLVASSNSGRSIGLLLGVRSCCVAAGTLAAGTRLRVDVTDSTHEEDGRGVLVCRIMRADSVVAEARLTVFQPEDPWVALEGQVA